jgi:hypothetical protein
MASINNLVEKLDALKHQGVHEYDPVRFCFIESLAHRATTQRDNVRELLEIKAQRVLDDYHLKNSTLLKKIDESEHPIQSESEIKVEKKNEQAKNQGQVISALVALRQRLASDTDSIQQGDELGASAEAIKFFSQQLAEQEKQMQHQCDEVSEEVNYSANGHARSLSGSSLKSSVAYQKFQHQKRIDHFIDNALNETPENPGPLNPEILVIRLLKQINNLSPEYISRYVGYFETLQWLEQEIRPSK